MWGNFDTRVGSDLYWAKPAENTETREGSIIDNRLSMV